MSIAQPRLRLAAALLGGLAIACGVAPASAQALTIGVAAPLSGSFELIGRQVAAGAREAAAALQVTAAVEDDACTADGGAAAARQFVAMKVAAVVGFLCTESIEAALPILKDAAIPVVTSGVRTDSLTDRRDKTGWLLWRLAPRADAEDAAVATILPRLWRDTNFAILDDGTIYGRDLAEAFRDAATEKGLKPVLTDTYRPQSDNQTGLAGRLRRAGAVNVFVGGDRDDIAIMARDARNLGASITFAGGEALRAASNGVALAPGTLMIGLPEWADIADPGVVAALKAQGLLVEGQILPAYAAMQVSVDALRNGGFAGLAGRTVPTAIGPVAFDGKHDLAQNPYRLLRFDGSSFQPVEGE